VRPTLTHTRKNKRGGYLFTFFFHRKDSLE
jgi:hypothetical protein